MTRHLPPPPPRGDLIKVLDSAIDTELLDRALTHRSYAYEKGGLPTNERLEFLGDAVLGLVVTTALFVRHPDLAEGQLAKQRASVVNMRALADVARTIGPIGLGPYLLLGRGEETTGGRDKASILADTLEAIIGAVYLSGGLEVASRFVHRLFDPLLDEAAGRGAGLDWKTSLQEQTALLSLGPPEYTVDQDGPDHAKRFTAYARIAGESLGEGEGGSKKEAEQRAAEAAFAVLEGRVAAAAKLAQEAKAAATGVAATNGSGPGSAGRHDRAATATSPVTPTPTPTSTSTAAPTSTSGVGESSGA